MNIGIYIIILLLILIVVFLMTLTTNKSFMTNQDEIMALIEKYIKGGWLMEPFIVNPNPPSVSSIKGEINKMALPDKLITNIKTCKNITYPLSQYGIKGSYNSANSGTYVSKEAIEYVIQRGCRFLDFEVYIDETGGPISSPSMAIVAYSKATINGITNTKMVKLDSMNKMSLDDVLSCCISNAFSASIAPNYGDPLFIQLRLKTGKSLLHPIINSIKYALMPKLYMDTAHGMAFEVNSETILSDIMGKIILVVDAGLTDITILRPYINILSDTSKWKKYYYRNIDNMSINPPTININTELNNLTSVKNLSMVIPASSSDIKIPLPFSVFAEYGIQTMLIPFFSVNNQNVIKYEQLFNSAKGGIVPLSTIISYSNDVLNETVV
jgi:hypothetical protein